MSTVVAERLPWPDVVTQTTVGFLQLERPEEDSAVRDASAAPLKGMLMEDALKSLRATIISYRPVDWPQMTWPAIDQPAPATSELQTFAEVPTLVSQATFDAIFDESTFLSSWLETIPRVRFYLLATADRKPKAAWFSTLMATAYDLTKLRPGWNGKDGAPASREDALTALRLLGRLPLETAPFLHPSPEGGMFLEVESAQGRVTGLIEGDLAAFWASADGYKPQTFRLDDAESEAVFVESFGARVCSDFVPA